MRLIFTEDGGFQILKGAEVTTLASISRAHGTTSDSRSTSRRDASTSRSTASRSRSAAVFTEYVKSVERISFRTGARRGICRTPRRRPITVPIGQSQSGLPAPACDLSHRRRDNHAGQLTLARTCRHLNHEAIAGQPPARETIRAVNECLPACVESPAVSLISDESASANGSADDTISSRAQSGDGRHAMKGLVLPEVRFEPWLERPLISLPLAIDTGLARSVAADRQTDLEKCSVRLEPVLPASSRAASDWAGDLLGAAVRLRSCGLSVRWTRGCRPEASECRARGFFELKVRPLLVARCFRCHGEKLQKGGFVWIRPKPCSEKQRRSAGQAGPPEESRLIEVIGYKEEPKMPPDGKLLRRSSDPREWVHRGAHFPLDSRGTDRRASQQSGRGRPCETDAMVAPTGKFPDPAPVKNPAWVQTTIDRFVLAKLEANGLTPSPAVDRSHVAPPT